MSLTRWTPFQELEAFQRRIPRLFEDIGFYPTMLPAADVYERDGEFFYELELPGFEEKDLTIEISDHILAIKGERKEKTEEAEKASVSTSASSGISSAASSSRRPPRPRS